MSTPVWWRVAWHRFRNLFIRQLSQQIKGWPKLHKMFALCLQHSSKMVPWSRCYLVTADCWPGPDTEHSLPNQRGCCEVLWGGMSGAGHCAAFLNRVTQVWHTAAEEHSVVQCNAVCISVLCNIIRFKKIQDPRLKSLTSLPGTHSRTYFLKETKCSLAALQLLRRTFVLCWQ